jgi:hypothetical protein
MIFVEDSDSGSRKDCQPSAVGREHYFAPRRPAQLLVQPAASVAAARFESVTLDLWSVSTIPRRISENLHCIHEEAPDH